MPASRWLFAAASLPATSSRWLSATVPQSSSPWHSRPAASSRWLFAAAPLAGSVFPMVHPFRQIAFLAGASCRARFPRSSMAPPASNSAKVPLPAALPDGSLPQCRHPLRHGTPGLQRLPDGSSLQRPWPATSSRWLFAAASLPAVLCADGPLPATASPQRLCRQQALSAPLPATNLIRQRKVLRFG